MMSWLRRLLSSSSTTPVMVRQGDVLVTSVRALPRGARAMARVAGRFVLAWGETTGHAHAIADTHVEAYERGGIMYLRFDGAPAVLRHEEHAPLELPPGTYRVVRQREYTPSERTVTGVSRPPSWHDVVD